MTTFTARSNGQFLYHQHIIPCSLGKNGVIPAAEKREGDLASPEGKWPLQQLLYRPDREPKPASRLTTSALKDKDAWCNDPTAGNLYNSFTQLPCQFSCENLWRNDHLYDLILVPGYNDCPAIPGKGSAIFLHLAKPDFPPTEGCIALDHADLLAVISIAKPGDILQITSQT